MREVILQLAAQGKLVQQSLDDEPATALHGKIEEFFEALRRRKEYRGALVAPPNLKNLPAIPSSWEWVSLGNVVAYGSPIKVDSSEIPEDAWLLDLEDIEKDSSRLIQRKLFHESPSKSTKTAFIAGDVLYGKLRPYLNKVLVADSPGYCTTEIIPIRTFGLIEPAYLCYALKRPEFIAYANSKSYGMNLPRLGTDDARNAPFPLPPLAEQKRIVAKVDELMALCDQLEAQQQERQTRHAALVQASLARFTQDPTPANLQFLFHPSYTISPADLCKTILTLAVQGKLVTQDPDDEPAEVFLESQRKQRIVKSKRNPEINSDQENEEEPFNLPVGWAWSRFPELGEFGRGKSKHRPRNDPSLFIDGTHRLVQTGDVARSNGKILTDSGCYNDVGLAQSKKWPAGTLCITIAANIADSGILGFEACFPDSIVGFIPAKPIPTVRYFEYFMRTAKEHLEQFAPATAQKNINLGILEQLWVPLPPLAEQRRIVVKVDELLALVDELETQLAASRTVAQNLLAALVRELTTTP
ncbi:MAG: restriction endonuclease subunit S [Salinivirgaceae bacterium]|nr:restriction endonuclease subunit S [Salinivirgaceae bacterium]